MKKWFALRRRAKRLVQTKSFYQGFWEGWAELLVLDPREKDPVFSWAKPKRSEQLPKNDVATVAEDFRKAMRKADKLAAEAASAR